jgi:hypothetical protein
MASLLSLDEHLHLAIFNYLRIEDIILMSEVRIFSSFVQFTNPSAGVQDSVASNEIKITLDQCPANNDSGR